MKYFLRGKSERIARKFLKIKSGERVFVLLAIKMYSKVQSKKQYGTVMEITRSEEQSRESRNR